MNGFIFGFQRLVWCPKWTPASSNSFTPILSTIFLWLRARQSANHPAEHGIVFDVVVAAPANRQWTIKAVFPFQVTSHESAAPQTGPQTIPEAVGNATGFIVFR